MLYYYVSLQNFLHSGNSGRNVFGEDLAIPHQELKCLTDEYKHSWHWLNISIHLFHKDNQARFNKQNIINAIFSSSFMHFFKEEDLVWNRLFCFTRRHTWFPYWVIPAPPHPLPRFPHARCYSLCLSRDTAGSPNTVWFRLTCPGRKVLWWSAGFRGRCSELLKDLPGHWAAS